MTLVDTSVWIDHLRRREERLVFLLEHGAVLSHPFVTGELSCGNLHNRVEFLRYLKTLRPAVAASDAEVTHLLEERKLWGRGIGWVDAHLLASALLSRCRLWTVDRNLRELAQELDLAAPHPAGR